MKREEYPLLAVDIDQTLAGGIVGAHLKRYNIALGLGLDPQHIDVYADRFPNVFAVPEIAAYRAKSKEHEDRFQQARGQIRTSQELHESLPTIPDAAETLNWFLSQYALRIGYFTVRPHEVESATRTWLQKNGFPNPDEVQISVSHEDKVKQVLTAAGTARSVLVDDSFTGLAEAIQKMREDDRAYQERLKNLTVVGFGEDAQNIPENIYALRTWERGPAAALVHALLTGKMEA